ncbi:hypothetical protein [Prosthecobacter sp.]|uniref:hypothetical protein n=1 Tax=Prosthecobacter sp. TaxID=1965333 RepID=UPI0037843355
MPNHVHVLFTLRDGESLPDTLQGWKGVSSRLIHKAAIVRLPPLLTPGDPDTVWESRIRGHWNRRLDSTILWVMGC